MSRETKMNVRRERQAIRELKEREFDHTSSIAAWFEGFDLRTKPSVPLNMSLTDSDGCGWDL
jgi:hypothetical protein